MTLIVENRRGLHARAAAKFVGVVKNFKSEVCVSRCGQTVSGSSFLGLMMLSASQGSEIKIESTGQDSSAVVHAICELIRAKFYEE